MRKKKYYRRQKTSVGKIVFTRLETADMLSISPTTLDRLAKRGLIKPIRATRRPLFAKKEIDRFIAATQKRIPLLRANERA